MKPFIGMCCLFLIFNHLQLKSQTQPYLCAWKDETPDVNNNSSSPCFDVDDIFKNCKTVYIRINLHFFVNDNCDGPVQQLDKAQKDVYKIAEEVIQFANSTFAYNQAQRQIANAVAPCVPIRLVLKGIYLHCKSDAVGISNTPHLNGDYGVNTATEINFYIAEAEDGATGVGYHNQRCGSGSAFNRDTWWSIGNLVHELGHILTLSHTFENDGCDDTPRIVYDWDKNCNGILENSSDPVLDETNLTCWNKLESNKNPGEDGFSDINKNNVNDCDEQSPCSECPCCKNEYIDNNVMSYSANKSALTECQVRKMLEDLSGFNCGLIEKIGDCPPASAFITQTPEDIKDQSRCRECLILEASMNEEAYELKIYERVNNQEILVYNGGWKTGKATTFCYHTGIAFQGLADYLKPNTQYVAYLKTKNSCSEDSYSYPFTTNNSNCGNVNYEPLAISPNPGLTEIFIEFTANASDENLQAIAKNMITGTPYLLLQIQSITSGINKLNLNVAGLPQGTYSILLLGEHSIYQNNFLKL